jgi:hypothetical protein
VIQESLLLIEQLKNARGAAEVDEELLLKLQTLEIENENLKKLSSDHSNPPETGKHYSKLKIKNKLIII